MRHMEELDEATIRITAGILGPSSAAAQAVVNYEKRVEAGEDVAFYKSGNSILVGPRLVVKN